MNTAVILELPYPCERDAKRALLRGCYRQSARTLRQLGYPGAALALEAHAEGLRPLHPVDDDNEQTIVQVWP